MTGSRLPRNALASIVQVVISAILLFVLYRVLIRKIGVEGIGLWSLVLAGASVGRIAEFGLSSGVVKFVAGALAHDNKEKAASDVCLSALAVAAILSVAMIMLYPLFGFLLDISIKAESSRSTAQGLLPYAMASFWINGVGGVFQSGLDGCQRIDLRSMIVTVSNALYVLAAYFLAGALGVQGVAWANLAQSLFVVTSSIAVLTHFLPLRSVKPADWSWQQFKLLLTYGVNIQVATLAQLLTEPATKTLLARFGGLSVTGYYEMANRMVTQFRAVIVSGYQALIPRVSSLMESNPDSLVPFYLRSYGLLAFLVPPYYAMLATAAPLIGIVWLGPIDDRFLFVAWAACLGWAGNTMAGPAYYSFLGIGRLRWTTGAHLTMGILNILLSGLLGYFTGWKGVVAGSMLSTIAGTAVVIVGFHREQCIPLIELFPAQNLKIAVSSVILSVTSLYITLQFFATPWNAAIAVIPVILFAFVITPLIVRHPTFTFMTDLVRRGLHRAA